MWYLGFICEFARNPKDVGTFTQSSKHLAKKMAQEIDGSAEVVEFGAGAGSVTREILKRLPENGRLTCFEINSKFCNYLEKINDLRLKVINDDAKNCKQYMSNLECIVSSLPLTLFPKPKRDKILDITSKAKRYIQLQYTPLLTKKMRSSFSDVKTKFVPQDFPPAFIHVCKSFLR